MKTGLRILVLLVLVAGIGWAVTHRHAIDPTAIRNSVVAAGAMAPVIFLALQVVASLLFIPRTVLGVAAGLLFGFVWGTVWAIAGAMLGAAAGFAFVRWFDARGMLDISPGIGRLIARAEHGGWRAVAMVRLVPLPHSVANTVLAMTNLSWRDYLLGSFAGMLPMTLVQADIGASGGELLEGGHWTFACLMLALGLGATFLLKRAASRRGSQPGPGKLD